MAFIIDRRENPKGKNLGNRQRFIRRAKAQIKDAVKKNIKDKNLKDLTEGGNIQVPVRDLKEPTFGNDHKAGKRKYVLTGNKEFSEEDEIERPDESGGRGSSGSPDGEGQDEFVFNLTRDEFVDIFFEDLELPNLTKKKLKDITTLKFERAGYTNTGNPTNIDIRQSTRLALARRIALRRPDQDQIRVLEEELGDAYSDDKFDDIEEIEIRLKELKRRNKAIPWIDPVDVRYRAYAPKPQPNVKAVMICVMDVSGSMGEREKDMAKRFFLLLHMFLSIKYKKLDIVFIRHTHEAQEVDEETFFYDPETGGTIVSKAFEEMRRIIDERYPVSEWNIYCAQASDGDNYQSDCPIVTKILQEDILPKCQYMAYIEIAPEPNGGMFHFGTKDNDLWQSYETLQSAWDNFQIKKVSNISEIYPVFRELFSKETV